VAGSARGASAGAYNRRMRPLIQAAGGAMLCIATALTALTVGTTASAASAADPGELPIGAVLRDVTLRGLNGPTRRLGQFRGEALVINVWASWCGPCRAEMSSLERLAWLRLPVHFRIIGVSTDAGAARAFLRESNATISQFIDTRQAVEHMLGASTIPLTVLVGADGRVLDKVYGARDWTAAASLALLTRTFRGSSSRRPARTAGLGKSADGAPGTSLRDWRH
jgi:thiol-disulfide isomerase/thioredoxin